MLDVGSVIDQFRAAMREHGIDIRGDIIADGTLRRAHAEGDKHHSESAWYILFADEHPNGTYGCWKRYGREKFSWSPKESTEWTPEQRRAWQEKMERQRLDREQADQERHTAAAARAKEIYEKAEPAEDDHPYLKRKKVKAHKDVRVGRWEVTNPTTGEKTTVSKLALLIPIRDTRKTIWSLQAIFPRAGANGRDKDYLKDGAKLGYYFSIGKPVDNVALVCEGYATGASLHEATGHAVAVAFDSGNLEAVANALRQALPPTSKIVVCGDNDQWTEKPIPNPGKHFAEAAAATMGGLVAIPQFQHLETKPTDFNDLAQLEGLETVRKIITAVLERPEEEEPPPPEQGEAAASAPIEGELVPKTEGFEPPPIDEKVSEDDARGAIAREVLLNNSFFEILGFDHSQYFFFHKRKGQLMEYSRNEFSELTLIELADPAVFWQRHFKGGKKGSFDKAAAANFLMRTAEEMGIYDPERLRGRGAWFDQKRIVYHHGSYLTVDGERQEIASFQTDFIYEMQRTLPIIDDSIAPLTDEEGDNLLGLAGSFRWTRPASAALLCGWILLAPICGALRWRPHIWLSGGAGSGKSTLLNEFVHPLLHGYNIFAQGNTTEAGLRQKLRTDSLPILFEESEQHEERDRMRIQHVLSLIRQSSTESSARVYKGTVGGQSMEFLIRSMFCLASIQVGIKHQADVERVTILALRPKKEAGDDAAADEWEKLEDNLHRSITQKPDVGARLIKRSMSMIPAIRENIRVFSKAAAEKFGSAREGDQYGTLLAGTWCMFRSTVATPDDAKGILDSYIWDEHRDIADSDESDQALSMLMESHIRAPNKNQDLTVHELAAAAAGQPVQGVEIDKLDAAALLKRHGMVVKDQYLFLSNNSTELRSMMSHTNFATDWRGVLLRLKGADRYENRAVKFNGVASKCIRIPLEPILADEAGQKSWLNPESHVER